MSSKRGILMDNSVDRYEVESIAKHEAAEARYEVLREVEEMFRIEREDRRETARDIKDGLYELSQRIWHIEVKLGIREKGGQWIGYGEDN
jgi:hypothetical protein